ncbi:MAG: hypothetical protein HOE80_02130 [Candidatus Magasanikbacteria bacterium]|nr:hypothetical protein [Candidatus Magasanikbacteria bacterium]MBT4071498.1 hypothetical protein [Candidatus Magasanikbacteria bacterium]
MQEEHINRTRQAMLRHIESVFQEIEESTMIQHQEKYAMLEDTFENANDVDELRMAFEQWYIDHADDLQLENSVDDLWTIGTSSIDDEEDYDEYEEEEEEEELS